MGCVLLPPLLPLLLPPLRLVLQVLPWAVLVVPQVQEVGHGQWLGLVKA